MKDKLKSFLFATATIILAACSPEEDSPVNTTPQPIQTVQFISLDSKGSIQTVHISRDITGATAYTKSGSFWISDIIITQDLVSFSVLENIYTEAGYRKDSIIIEESGHRIGAFAVYQARTRVSPTKLEWALPGAKYYETSATDNSGLAFAQFILNNDDFRLYPALAYCLEMNHNLDSIEWYLPSGRDEVPSEYWETLLDNDYWWSSSNYNNMAHPFSRTSGSRAFLKGAKLSVIAVRIAS